jgi:hypothetical protein
MKRTDTNLAGQIKNDPLDSNYWTKLTGQIGRDEAETAAIAVQFLRENSLTNLPEGRAIMREALSRIKGTKWEEVLFPKPRSSEDRAFLNSFWRDAEASFGHLWSKE